MENLHWSNLASICLMTLVLLFPTCCFASNNLHDAITTNNTELVISLISSGSNVNELNSVGETPLLTSAKVSTVEICTILVEKGAKLDVRGRDGKDLVESALDAEKVENAKYFATLDAFAEYKALGDEVDALKNAIRDVRLDHVKYIAIVLQISVFNTLDEPFLLKIRNSTAETCQFLAYQGIDPDVLVTMCPDNELITAVKEGNFETVKSILDAGRININDTDLAGVDPFAWAVFSNELEIAKLLLDHGSDINRFNKFRGLAPIHHAAGNCSLTTLQFLKDNGANLLVLDRDGRNALMDTMVLFRATDKVENLKFLLDTDLFDVNSTDLSGDTALHFAAESRQVEYVTLLIGRNADVNAVGRYNETPLLRAVQYPKVDVARVLVDNGADLAAVDKNGNNPLILASLQGNPDVVKLLLNTDKFNINDTNFEGEDALIMALNAEDLESTKTILAKGLDVNRRYMNGETVFFHAARYSNAEICRFLVENGASVFDVDKHNNSALFMAVSKRNLDIVDYLLDTGNFPAASTVGEEAFLLAMCKEVDTIVDRFVKSGYDAKVAEDFEKNMSSYYETRCQNIQES